MKNEELKQWIEQYDNGTIVETVSMGGMGEGYEAAIQSCAIETMRNLQENEVPEDIDFFRHTVNSAIDIAVELLNKTHGFSGAQVGAAKNIASIFWRNTPEKGLEMMRKSNPKRIIQIRKNDNGNVSFINPLED